jgi:hypothetical protein
MQEPSVKALFPTLLQTFNFEPPDGLIERCYDVQNKQKYTARQRSNRLGFQSNVIPFVELTPVRKYIDEHTITGKLKHGRAWVNINPLGGYNVQHTHPNSDYTFVYYLTDSTVEIVLNHPHQFEQFNHAVSVDEQYGRQYGLSSIHKIKPKRGDILMFPSYVPHHVESNTVSRDRISISWNSDVYSLRGPQSWAEKVG